MRALKTLGDFLSITLSILGLIGFLFACFDVRFKANEAYAISRENRTEVAVVKEAFEMKLVEIQTDVKWIKKSIQAPSRETSKGMNESR